MAALLFANLPSLIKCVLVQAIWYLSLGRYSCFLLSFVFCFVLYIFSWEDIKVLHQIFRSHNPPINSVYVELLNVLSPITSIHMITFIRMHKKKINFSLEYRCIHINIIYFFLFFFFFCFLPFHIQPGCWYSLPWLN